MPSEIERTVRTTRRDPAAGRVTISNRLWVALVVYVLWVAITLFGAKWLLGGRQAPLEELVKNGVGWQFVAAAALLIGAIAVFQWRDVKFVAPRSLLEVMWFPMLVLLAISSLVTLTGLPGGKVMFWVAFNTFLVGLSEEVMFRGVLFRALLENFEVWPAIIVTTLLFGAAHVFNGFTTGQWGTSVLQAMSACMSGLIFMAIVIRTGSIWPAIVYHWAWDCALFLMKTGSQTKGIEADPAQTERLMNSPAMFLPMLLVLPNFLCALVLLRKVRDTSFRRADTATI